MENGATMLRPHANGRPEGIVTRKIHGGHCSVGHGAIAHPTFWLGGTQWVTSLFDLAFC